MSTSINEHRIVQVNLNHARRAQDLLMQLLDERDSGLAIVSEPYRIPAGNPNWVGSPDGSAAIVWRRSRAPVPLGRVGGGDGYVIAKWGRVYIVSVYLSPRLSIAEVEGALDGISGLLAGLGDGAPTIVAGDFNAHAVLWGSRQTNARGRLLIEWATAAGLSCVNSGSISTCVRTQGESIVDTTWASPACVNMISGWGVLAGSESLSDHCYIEFLITVATNNSAAERDTPRRWAVRKLDADKLEAALLIDSWAQQMREEPELDGPPVARVERLCDALRRACDVAMPRVKPMTRRAAYWWSEEISDLRGAAVSARRHWTRSRRNGADREAVEANRGAYREAKKALGMAIGKAKARSWGELLSSLDDDPWGLAYKLVREKLRKWSFPITERLDLDLLDRVTDTLFPDPPVREGRDSDEPGHDDLPIAWDETLEVTKEEVKWAVKKMASRNAAPGPDGIPGKVIAKAYRVIGEEIRSTLTCCLKAGWFPTEWRRANLVLLHKAGKEEGLPSSYRPICLLDEMGKILERIVSYRIQNHLAVVGPDLHRCQYGFRRGLSTMDAVLRVKEFARGQVDRGGVVLAVSLDISNAFNTLPWDRIREALARFDLPPYIRRILASYLGRRSLEYKDQSGLRRARSVRRGVPQGSVLGPLLWDLGFDRVLSDVALPPGCCVVCYADDTLVLAAGRNWGEARIRANGALAGVTRAIRALDLKVAPQKTEAVFFHDGSWGEPPEAAVAVDGERIRVGKNIRYLGLTIDGAWTFVPHFVRLEPRLEMVANQCARLMPNLGGPRNAVRRLYATAVSSVALYGAPAWAEEAGRSPRILRTLRVVLRRVATRVVRGYRTISFASATLLAGLPPLELKAEMFAETFRRSRVAAGTPEGLTPRRLRAIKANAKRRMHDRWVEWAGNPALSGIRVREAVGPNLEEWVSRKWGHLTYRLTQIFTGHGCFGAFLCRIGREATPRCHHCAAPDDTAQHTLEACHAWDREREDLTRVLGADLSLNGIVQQLLHDPKAWVAFAAFCEKILVQKEAAERDRRGEGPRDPRRHQLRRRRGGGGGGAGTGRP